MNDERAIAAADTNTAWRAYLAAQHHHNISLVDLRNAREAWIKADDALRAICEAPAS